MSEPEVFYFDEFFADEGVDILLPIRGRKVPLRIRRGLPLKEKAAAQAVAVKRHVDPNSGRVVIDQIDESLAAEEIAYRMILSWPFINRDGSKVSITRENVSKLLGGMDTLVSLVEKMEQEGDAALVPFVAPSTTVSEASQPIE